MTEHSHSGHMQHDIFPFHFALTAVFFSVSSNKLQELRIILLGQKTFGKSATGNTLLHKDVFASSQNEQCQVQEGEVSGRRVTMIVEIDKEIFH